MAQVCQLAFSITALLLALGRGHCFVQGRYSPVIQGEVVQSEKRNVWMVGADETTPNQYPFMVALMRQNGEVTDKHSLYCGASLISSSRILTAAHCVNDLDTNKILGPERFIVLLGMHFMNESMNDAQLAKRIIGVTVHEEFDSIAHLNDIAMLTMETPVTFTSTISPVHLPPFGSSDQYFNRIAIAQGWGRILAKGTNSDSLRHVGIRIISNSLCRKSYMDEDKIADHKLCTWLSGYLAKTPVNGGPLIVEVEYPECRWMQVGIVSFGRGCARRFPGVYTRMTSFLPWIEKRLKS